MTTVDVVVPVRDGARYLPACLDSVLAQTRAVDNIFVVDDGSVDESPAIVTAYAKRDPRVRLIRTEPRGLPHARNVGIKASSATFVAFVDSDDIWRPEKVERQMAVFEAAPEQVGFVHCAYFSIDAQGSDLARKGLPVPSKRGEIFNDLFDGYPLSGSASAVILRRELAVRAGLFDESLPFSEDLDLWLRLATICHVDFTPEALVGIREHAGSMQGRRDPGRPERRLLSRLHIFEKWMSVTVGNERLLNELRHDAVRIGVVRFLRGSKPGFHAVMHSRAPILTEAMFGDERGYRRYVRSALLPIAIADVTTLFRSTVVSYLAHEVVGRSPFLLRCCHRVGKLKNIQLPS